MNVNPISQFKFSEYTNGLNFTAKQDAGTPPHAGGTGAGRARARSGARGSTDSRIVGKTGTLA